MRPMQSPRPRRARGRSLRRAGAPVLAAAVLAATAITAAPAGAATPTFPTITDAVQPASGALTGAGSGHVAWITRQASDPTGEGPTRAVWTMKEGAPKKVADVLVPGGRQASVPLEVGTTSGGTPVVAFLSSNPTKGAVIRLVDLDTGATGEVPATRGDAVVDGFAVDEGKLYTTVHVARVGARNTSALWRAPLTGLQAGKATKIRGSRRGETWSTVFADQGRIAIQTARNQDEGTRPGQLRQIAFGTPLGAWKRTGDVLIQEGPVDLVDIGGFTKDRAGLVTLQNPDDGPRTATLTSLRTGRTTGKAILGPKDRSLDEGTFAGSFSAGTGQFFGNGFDAAGTAQLGYTDPVFLPATRSAEPRPGGPAVRGAAGRGAAGRPRRPAHGADPR